MHSFLPVSASLLAAVSSALAQTCAFTTFSVWPGSIRHIRRIRRWFFTAALSICAGLPLQAAQVSAVSNLAQPFGVFTVVGKSTSDFHAAINFTTGEISTRLSSVSLSGNAYGEPVTAFKVSLYRGISTEGPTGLVATLVGENPTSASSRYTYVPAAATTLEANSTYWLVASAPSAAQVSGFSWRSTSSGEKDAGALPGWGIGTTRWMSNNGGAAWFAVSSTFIPQFSIQVDEPLPTAPAITTQPLPQTAYTGTTTSLSVTATGYPALSYQWRKDGVAVPGATSSTIVINPVARSHAGSYSVVVANSVGSVASRAAQLDVTATSAAVSNLGQPFQTTVQVDNTLRQAVSFTTGADISYLYTVTLNGSGVGNVSGLTVALYSGFDSSGPTGLLATLVGNARPTSLGIYSYSPATPLKLAAYSSYYVVVSALGTAASTSFSWRSTGSTGEDSGARSGWNISNSRWSTNNGGASWFTVGGAIPQLQINTIEPSLAITAQPVAQTGVAGSMVVFSVTATGDAPRLYQWRKDDVALVGATNSSLTLTPQGKADAGKYSVVVVNSAGSITSQDAILGVNPASVLSNLSVRTTMAAGQVLIVGAVVAGGAKTVLVRAAGPALNSFNLSGMADPRLDLFTTGSTPTVTNDDWAAALSPAFASVGAFPFAAGSKDAALSQSLNGAFTVQTRGSGAGTVLVEAYDVAGGASPRLVNFSARSRVGTGSDILIIGLTVAGSGAKQVLVRAIGPGLAALGVQGALSDPRLQVVNNSGTVVGENDNWDSSLAATFSQLGAFALPSNSRDSAVLLSLDASASYTLQVSGADGGTGEALVEVYEIF